METVKFRLDPDIKTVWRIGSSISLVILTLVFFLIEALLLSGTRTFGRLPTGLLSLSFLLLTATYRFMMIAYRYKSWWFEVREDEVYLERGVFNRIKTIVPYIRIQHLDVQQGMIERWCGLGRLVIYTAGTKGGEIIIPGLPFHYAEELRDSFKEKIKLEDEV